MSFKRVLKVVLVIICLLAITSKIFLGFDCDEQYALSMPYRLYGGDKLIIDIWDPYQLSSIFSVPLFYILNKLQGNLSNIVVLDRLFGVCVQLLVGLFVYKVIAKYISKDYALLSFLLFILITPKQTYITDHSNLLNWFITIMILSLYVYYKEKNKLILPIVSITYAFSVLAYPTQAILFPILIYLIYKVNDSKTDLVTFIMPIIILFLSFMKYVLNGTNMTTLLFNVKNILNEGSHNNSVFTRVASNIGIAIISFSLIIFIILLINYLYKKIINNEYCITKNKIYQFSVIIYPVLIIVATIIGTVWPPIARYRRYLLLTLIGLDIVFKRKEKHDLLLIVIPLLTSFICLVTSNQGIDSASGYLGLSSAYSLAVLLQIIDNEKNKTVIMILLLTSQIIITGFTARVSGTPGFSIKNLVPNDLEELNYILINPEDEMAFEESKEIKSIVGNSKTLFLVSDPIFYTFSQAKIYSPLTLTTPVYDNQWVDYYKYKNEKPKFVVMEKDDYNNTDLVNTPLYLYLFSDNYTNKIYEGNVFVIFEYGN